MPTFHNCICEYVEEACKTFFDGKITAGDITLTAAGQVRTAFCPDALTGNHIIFTAEEANPEEIFDGNWTLRLRMEVVSDADGFTQVQHRERFGEAVSWFMTDPKTDAIWDKLNAAHASLTIQYLMPRRQSKRIDGRKWISIQEFELKCAGTTGLNA
jgi:hypothetical protein